MRPISGESSQTTVAPTKTTPRSNQALHYVGFVFTPVNLGTDRAVREGTQASLTLAP